MNSRRFSSLIVESRNGIRADVRPVRLCFVCGMDLPHEPTAGGWKCSQCGAVGGGS